MIVMNKKQTVYLFIYLFVRLIHLFNYLLLTYLICLFVFVCLCLFVYLCLFVCLCLCLFVCFRPILRVDLRPSQSCVCPYMTESKKMSVSGFAVQISDFVFLYALLYSVFCTVYRCRSASQQVRWKTFH